MKMLVFLSHVGHLIEEDLKKGFSSVFASIEVVMKHHLAIDDIVCNRNVLVEIVTEKYRNAFVQKWGGKCQWCVAGISF